MKTIMLSPAVYRALLALVDDALTYENDAEFLLLQAKRELRAADTRFLDDDTDDSAVLPFKRAVER